MALLINTETWKRMIENWRVICLVFWNIGNNHDDHDAKRNYSNLLSRISSIKNDSNSKQAIEDSKSIIKDTGDVFTFDEESESQLQNNSELSRSAQKQGRKITSEGRIDRVVSISDDLKIILNFVVHQVFDEEEELNQMDSSFKQDMGKVFQDCSREQRYTENDSDSNSKMTKGARDWLTHIMKNCVPTIPIWSNLLLRKLTPPM